MKREHLLCLLCAAASFLMPVRASAQGSLNPPGSPAPTMRSLDQIYNEVAKLTAANPLALPPGLSPNQQGVIHLTAKGQTQGDIRGECTIRGLENSIVCIGFSHEIISPRDAASGLPTGRRQHKPLRVIKYADKTTPLFYSALVRNENLPTVVLKFFQTDAKGNAVNYLKITLMNANLSRVASDFPNLETLEFTYQKIEWLHVPSGTVADDDWETSPS